MKDKLVQFKKSYITLSELEQLLDEHQSYESFANALFELIQVELIKPVRSAGQTPQMHSIF